MIDLHELANCFSEILPEDAIFLSDSGFAEIILPTNIKFKDKQRCIHPVYQGCMGFALPAAIGAYYASNNQNIIAVVGDGSIMMNLQELATIKHQNIPLKLIIINNNNYGIIRKRQKTLFRRTIGTGIEDGVGEVNFKKIAKGFGIPYIKIKSNSDLKSELKSLLDFEGPILCEILGLDSQSYLGE